MPPRHNGPMRRKFATRGLVSMFALAAAALVGYAALTSRGSASAAVGQTPHRQSAERYVEVAVLEAANSPACASRHVPSSISGPPPSSLLSILGVLRRPATAADELPSGSAGRQPQLYVNYVRFARKAYGERWYVWVSGSNDRPPADAKRCLAAERQDFRREEPRIPESLRSAATVQFESQLRAERRVDERPTTAPGVWLIGYGRRFGGGGGGAGAAQIERAGMWSSQSGGTGADPGRTLFGGVVPDGVSTVTLQYPAGKLGGFSHRRGPALTVTAPVLENVVVVSVERAGNQATGAVTTTWRAENGAVIKTLHGNL